MKSTMTVLKSLTSDPGITAAALCQDFPKKSGGMRSPGGGGPPSWSTPVADHKISRHGHGTSHAHVHAGDIPAVVIPKRCGEDPQNKSHEEWKSC